MKEYLKMADVFEVGTVDSDHVISISIDCLSESWCGDDSPNEYAAHAINSHDELVAEVERLRRQLAYSFMAGWEEGINEMEYDEAERLSIEIAAQFARN